MKENWRAVKGYEGKYEVSDLGRVRSLNYGRTGRSKIMKLHYNNNGYLFVGLSRNNKVKHPNVHRLVYEAFRGPIPDGMQIDHINTVRDDNRLENLRCVTPSENHLNTVTRKRKLEANRQRLAKPVLQLDKDTGEVIREWQCARDAVRELGISKSSLSSCCHGKRNSAGGFKWKFA